MTKSIIVFCCFLILACNGPGRDGTLTVRGYASANVYPTSIELLVSIESEYYTSDSAALDDLNRKARIALDILKKHGVKSGSISTNPVEMQRLPISDTPETRYRYKGTQKINGALKISDHTIISMIKHDLLEHEGMKIHSISFSYSECGDLNINLYREAARNARRAADSISSILGTRTGSVIKVQSDTTKFTCRDTLLFAEYLFGDWDSSKGIMMRNFSPNNVNLIITRSLELHVTYSLRR
ncbi:hypothetical protein CHISP_3332 [Chitinispirillum alkaliphilum]|nr:hypothetical protein CHISP_3332 [Chitinispirillum alkaliphilum]